MNGRGLKCWVVCGAFIAACVDGEQARVSVPLQLSGTATDSFETARGVEVTLDRAELAFGPLYLCSSTEAGDACDTARAEWLDSVVVDALDPTANKVGVLDAVSGPYRSFMYDLGISSLLTHDAPVELDAAQALDGMSVVIEGSVLLQRDAVPFSIALPIARSGDNELGVPVVRVRADEASRHDIAEGDTGLLITFDARRWLTSVDFEALCADASACAALSPEGQAGRAVRNAITAGTPPTLRWNP